MKNLIIIIGTILLGCIIFNMMTGPGGLKDTAEKELVNSVNRVLEENK